MATAGISRKRRRPAAWQARTCQAAALALACGAGLLLPSAVRAQTEIEKTVRAEPARQSEVGKGTQDSDADRPAPEPVGTPWSAVSDRAVAASAAEITGDDRRTRFSIVLSAAVPYQYFALADPYRLIIDMPDVSFGLPKGSGQQGRGLIQAYRYGLFAPGKSRIVIDTKGPVRIERAAMTTRPGATAARLEIDLAPTDRASFLTRLPAARDARRRRRAGRIRTTFPAGTEGPTPRPVIVIDAGHGGVDPGSRQRRGPGEGRRALGCAASAHDPGGQGPL